MFMSFIVDDMRSNSATRVSVFSLVQVQTALTPPMGADLRMFNPRMLKL